MPIDPTIQFNSHNSYKVLETVWSYPFGVEGKAYVTHSFQKYATSALSSAVRARTRFFASDGSIVSTIDHSFAVIQVWEKEAITVAVPATAVLCQLAFLTSGTWWAAEPKSEEGQTATPYNTNYAGQLTFITPNGIYTGGITASQIVVAGTLASPSEALDERLVTINSNAINLSATTSAHGSRLTLIEAGQITINGSTTFDATANIPGARIDDGSIAVAKLGTTVIVGGYIKTGLVSASNINVGTLSADRIAAKSISGAKLADGTVGDLQVASGLSATKITAGRLQSVDGTSYFDLTNGQIKSNNVDLTGKIVATSGNIGGLVVGANDLTITVSKVFGPFSQSDIDRVQSIVLGHITPTTVDYSKYDFVGSGRFTAINLTIMSRMIAGTEGFTNPMTITYQVIFSTSGTNNLVTLKNSLTPEQTVIRPASVETANGNFSMINTFGIAVQDKGGVYDSFIAKNESGSGSDVKVTLTSGIVTAIDPI